MYIILFFSILQLALNTGLTDIKINGGNYGYIFKFFISGTTDESINKSINIPVILLVDGDEKEAKCSIENTDSGNVAFYSCLYDGNINGNDIYIKYEENNIFGIDNNSENNKIKPLVLNIKFLEVTNLEFYDINWQYDLKGEILNGEQITLGFISYMPIKVNNTNTIAGCILSSQTENKLLFNCKINTIEQELSNKITISGGPNEAQTLNFDPQLTSDIKFIVSKYISFIEAKDLLFNEGKWHFSVIVPYQSLPIATKSIIDILYNGTLSSATCITNDDSMLDCIVDKEEQNEIDLVKIHFIKSEHSTLTWKDLTKIFEIPIEKELTYLKSYDLIYTSTNLWSFKINSDDANLPENSLVKIDIKLNNELTYAKCYHSNNILSCKTEVINEEDTLSLKISYEKKYGSITWTNIASQDIYIPVTAEITYENAYNLHFENNVWYFILKTSTYEEINKNFPISIKINYGEEKKNGIAFCFQDNNNLELFNCETYYENQNNNDLILINGNIGEESVIWGTVFETKSITLLASLHYTKAYDLKFSDENEKWSFKIEIEDDLPNDSKLVVDILVNEVNIDTATCLYNNKILSCTRDSLVQKRTESLNLQKEKQSGSTTWENIEKSKIEIPLSITTKLINAYGLFFTDNWNFYIDVNYIGVIPDNSFFVLDIIQNEIETTAICQISNRTQSTETSTMSCHLESNDQSILDEIKINTENKYGSISWSEEITNQEILEESSDPILFHILDAYDLEFLNSRWSFKVVGNVDRDLYKGEIFTLEIKYILLEGEYDSTAKCWTEGGSKDEKIYFSCNVEYPEQTNKGIIQISYFQTETSK